MVGKGALDDYLPYELRFSTNDRPDGAVADMQEAAEWLKDKIRSGEKVIPYDAQLELDQKNAVAQYEQEYQVSVIDGISGEYSYEEIETARANAELQAAANEEREATGDSRFSIPQDEAGSADRSTGTEARDGSGRAEEGFLSSYSNQDILAQEAAQSTEQKAQATAAKQAQDERDRAEIKQRSEGAAQDFQLGQSAEQNLSGQGDIFGATTQSSSNQAGNVKQNKFGKVFTEFYHNAKGAIAKLMQEKQGDAVAALYHPEVGDIDLVWGHEGSKSSDGYGLSKIAAYHPEVLQNLQDIIDGMTVKQRGKNRVRLESANHEASVSLDWFGEKKTWLLTAYEKGADTSTTMDTGSTVGKGDTARSTVSPDSNITQQAEQSKQSAIAVSPALAGNLPSYLHDPKYVFAHKDGGLRLVTKAVTAKGEPIIVGVKDGRVQTITPIHDKDGLTGSQRLNEMVSGALSERGGKVYAENKEALEESRASLRALSGGSVLGSEGPQLPNPVSRHAATVFGMDNLVNKYGEGFYQNGIRLSRSSIGATHNGMNIRDLRALVSRVRKSYKNMPDVVVLESPGALDLSNAEQQRLYDYIASNDALKDVEGATHEGKIYLFASGMPDEFRAEFVIAQHEITHVGLRAVYGTEADAVLQTIWMNNPSVRAMAAEVKQDRGITSNIEATEEVLADMPTPELVKLKGWRKLVQMVRNWFERHGFAAMAKRLDTLLKSGMSERQQADLLVADVVSAAREWVKSGKSGQMGTLHDTRLSRESAGNSADAGVLFQTGKKRDDYTLDLFGVPENAGDNPAAGEPAARRSAGRLSRDDALGTYATRTELVEENTRQLGTDQVTTIADAAQALACLAKGAVERFDALITDASGKPLAIVGAFKGARARCLIVAVFQQQPAARVQMRLGVCDDVTQTIQTVIVGG